MATLIVRNPSTVSTRSRTDEWAWDPFLSMRELLGMDTLDCCRPAASSGAEFRATLRCA